MKLFRYLWNYMWWPHKPRCYKIHCGKECDGC